MKTSLFSSIAACSAVFALLLSYGNTQADPLTPTAKVKVTTLVRAEGTPPQVIRLAPKASRTNNMTKLSFASAGPCSSSRHESCPA